MSDERDIFKTIKPESLVEYLKESIYYDKNNRDASPALADLMYFKKETGFVKGQILVIMTGGSVSVPNGSGRIRGWYTEITLYYEAFDYDDFQLGMLLVHKEIKFTNGEAKGIQTI